MTLVLRDKLNCRYCRNPKENADHGKCYNSNIVIFADKKGGCDDFEEEDFESGV